MLKLKERRNKLEGGGQMLKLKERRNKLEGGGQMPKVVELPKLEVNEEIKIGGNGHKLSLRQRIARWLLRDAHIDELHIGAHSINIDGDVIKMNALASNPGTPAEGWLWFLAAAAHKLRFCDNTGVKDVGEGAAPGAHDLAGAQHNPDTLANLNSKVSDGTLDKTTDKRDPNAHKTSHENGGADELSLAGLDGEPAELTTHKGIADAHHAKYTDTEAQTTVKNNVEVGDLKAPTKALPMNSQKITGLGAPTVGGDAATKDHVDSVVQGLDWQKSVLSELATPPGTPTTGDRHLVIATATGDWVGYEDDIAEWNGTSWDFTSPNKGFAVWIEDVGRQKNYNGTAWVAFGTTVDHGNLIGLADDDHANYLNNTRHDTPTRHTLGTVVPHDALANLTEKAHGSLTGIGTSDHHVKTTASEINLADLAEKAHGSLTGVGATDHHDNSNDPTAGEKSALGGTSGTPGAANKFVTDEDPRNTNARTPTAHDHSGETLNPEVVNVGDVGFKNGYRLIEDKKYGVVLISPSGLKFRMVKC